MRKPPSRGVAFWTTSPGCGDLREEDLEPPSTGDGMLVRALFSGVSRGTEALVFSGRVPPTQYELMRAPLMRGSFPFPVKYGYSMVGEADGHRVFVLHPHQDWFYASASMCVPVPENVPSARAVLAANMETALNILWDAAPLAGERILVVGAGVVGLLAASLLARIPATRVTVTDINPARETLARGLGCEFASPETVPFDQELILHTSATEAGLRTALEHASVEGRIIEASWFGNRAPAVPFGEAFHSKRLSLVSSQVGMVGGRMRGRRSYRERLSTALALLSDPAYDALLEGPTAFRVLPQEMPHILSPGGLCHIISYGAE
jgi:hypothetical protein